MPNETLEPELEEASPEDITRDQINNVAGKLATRAGNIKDHLEATDSSETKLRFSSDTLDDVMNLERNTGDDLVHVRLRYGRPTEGYPEVTDGYKGVVTPDGKDKSAHIGTNPHHPGNRIMTGDVHGVPDGYDLDDKQTRSAAARILGEMRGEVARREIEVDEKKKEQAQKDLDDVLEA